MEKLSAGNNGNVEVSWSFLMKRNSSANFCVSSGSSENTERHEKLNDKFLQQFQNSKFLKSRTESLLIKYLPRQVPQKFGGFMFALKI